MMSALFTDMLLFYTTHRCIFILAVRQGLIAKAKYIAKHFTIYSSILDSDYFSLKLNSIKYILNLSFVVVFVFRLRSVNFVMEY